MQIKNVFFELFKLGRGIYAFMRVSIAIFLNKGILESRCLGLSPYLGDCFMAFLFFNL